jgi:enoyl-CoA hydratase/carnithine racemase
MNATASEPLLLVDRPGPDNTSGILRLTLNRPRARNALSSALMRTLLEALEHSAADTSVRAIVLAANGPVFSAGHDLREMTEARADRDHGKEAFAALFTQCSALMMAIVHHPRPVIAEVQGLATAAGCQLVASCDLAVAADTARFATPGVDIGLFCSTPMVALSRNVPRKQAMHMLLTGDAVTAEEAVRIGLINRAVPAADLTRETTALAEKIAAKPFATIRTGKHAFYEQLEMGLEEAYHYAAQVMTENMLHAEASEGICAFLEKRAPKWPK